MITSSMTGTPRVLVRKSILQHYRNPLIYAYSENPNLDREVLKAGFAQYHENRLNSPFSEPLTQPTVDDFERLGRKRLARITGDGYLLNMSNIHNSKINYQRLIIQCGAILIAIFMGFLIASDRKQ